MLPGNVYLAEELIFQFYCATMYLPIETECYSVVDRKSYQRAESWKLSRPNAGSGVPGAGSLHRKHRC